MQMALRSTSERSWYLLKIAECGLRTARGKKFYFEMALANVVSTCEASVIVLEISSLLSLKKVPMCYYSHFTDKRMKFR